MKINQIINIVLVVAIIVLIFNIIQPFSNLTGAVSYHIDQSEPKCEFNNQEMLSEVPLNMCCYEIMKQRTCKVVKEETIKCYTLENSKKYFLLNHKAFNHCERSGYDVFLE
jgi:hypothetical protein